MFSNINTSETEWSYSESDVAQKFLFFNVLKDGRVHVLSPPADTVPPSFGSTFGVLIKDVEICPEVSARIFLPSSVSTNTCITCKVPVLFYIHGGGFCMRSAFSEHYTRFCSQIAAEANVIVVSVEYGLFPTRPLPDCYDDSWEALQWVASHGNSSGPEAWINDHADLGRIFVGGNSAGGNIAHTVLARVGSIGLHGDAKVKGMILIHPYFAEDDKMWMYMCPTNTGPKDPRMKPAAEDLAIIGCRRLLLVLAENDGLYGAGKMYAEELIRSGWRTKENSTASIFLITWMLRPWLFVNESPPSSIIRVHQNNTVLFMLSTLLSALKICTRVAALCLIIFAIFIFGLDFYSRE